MRIRKHAKISPLLYASSHLNPGTVLQTHICQLNQSPWDAMNFSPPATPPPPQVSGNDGSMGNVGSRDSVEVVDSYLSQNEPFLRRIDKNISLYDRKPIELNTSVKWVYSGSISGGDTITKVEEAEEEYSNLLCSKTDGKSWKCRREAAKGNSLCSHHLSMVRSYNSAHPSGKNPAKSEAADSKRRPRIKKPSEVSSSSNPYEFYYYSGFGPRWGKRRGEINKNNSSHDMPKDVGQESDMETSTNSQIEDGEFDCVEEDDEGNGESPKKKKARKLIKARSLKSLM